jgi:hypothetical protein
LKLVELQGSQTLEFGRRRLSNLQNLLGSGSKSFPSFFYTDNDTLWLKKIYSFALAFLLSSAAQISAAPLRLWYSIVGPPPEIKIENISAGKNLSDMLIAGEVDALLTAQVPAPFVKCAPQVRRLFADPRAAEADHFRRTGIFPIMLVLVVREEFYQRILGSPKVSSNHCLNPRITALRRFIKMMPFTRCCPGPLNTQTISED